MIKFRLGTASLSGSYYPIGLRIKQICEQNIPKLEIEVHVTNGSVDNLVSMADGSLELAIVQNDIAYLAENIVPSQSSAFSAPIRNVLAIATLYPEPIFILTSIRNANHLLRLRDHTISIGRLGSGTAVDAEAILSEAGVWATLLRRHDDKSALADLFEADSIQAVVLNSIPPRLIERLSSGELHFISLSRTLLGSLQEKYPFFTSHRQLIGASQVTTVAVKAVLVARSDTDEQIVRQITDELFRDWDYLSQVFPRQVSGELKSEIVQNKGVSRWHPSAEEYYFAIGALRESTPTLFLFSVFAPLLIIVTLWLVNIFLFSFNRRGLSLFSINSRVYGVLRHANLLVIKFKYVFLLLFILGAYLASVVAIENLERQWSLDAGIPSAFQSSNFLENVRWLLVFSISGHDGGIFPSSSTGQFVTMLIPILGLGGLFAFVAMLTSDHVKNHLLVSRGMKTTMLKDHILVCGWNSDTPFLVRNLVHDNISQKRSVVILADIPVEMPLVQHNLEHDLVCFVRGDATNRSDLKKANIVAADVALLIADDGAADPDAMNILKALTIEKYCLELEALGHRKGRPNIRTIAEINQADNAETARDALVDEIVSLGHIKSKIFVLSALTPGALSFINEILTYNEYNDIYPISIEAASQLYGLTFDEILVVLRKHKILLMSICANRDEIDKSSSGGLSRRVITNPLTDEECNYRTQSGDYLIVLAQFEKIIDDALILIHER